MEIVEEELQLAQNAFVEHVCAWVINISHIMGNSIVYDYAVQFIQFIEAGSNYNIHS